MWVVVILVAVLVAHSCGYLFGVANQATYFLHALQHAHPELYRHDWLVASTSGYHSVFSYLAGALYAIDGEGVIAFAIAHVAIMIVVLIGVYLLVRATSRRMTLAIFVLITAWLLVDQGRSIAGSYVWSGYLQPSLLGAAGWIVALAFYVQGRPLATGIALAAGGIFHVNFLILGIGAFGLAELVVAREQRIKRLALLLAPQLVAVAVLLPEILANASSSDPERALWVLVQFHAPLHYKPSWIARTLPEMLRWIALAAVVVPVASAYADRAAVRRLLGWSVIVAAIVTLGTLVMMVPGFLSLTRVYVWRLAPFAILAARVVIAIAIAATVEDPRAWLAQPWWRRIAALGLLAWIITTGELVENLVLVAIPLALVVPWRAQLFALAATATLVVPLWGARDKILHPVVDVERDATDALCAWARTTPIDATFLTPPDLSRFRFVAQRAIYADFKSPPLDPDGLIEWHERLVRMTGASATDKIPAHRKGWVDATGDQLLGRAKALGLDYLVLDRSPAHDQTLARPLFQDSRYAAFATRAHGP